MASEDKNSSCFDNEMETDFVDSHNVCSRFYIQMSSSYTPRGALTLSRKSISYSLAVNRKLTLTYEWHAVSVLWVY